MMGTTLEELLDTFDTCNLNTDLKGTNGKWDLFDRDEANHMARYLTRSITWQYDVVLTCGAQVAKAFGWEAPGTTALGETAVVSIPHPGGTNMWWNKTENREEGATLARLAWRLARGAGAPVWPLDAVPGGVG